MALNAGRRRARDVVRAQWCGQREGLLAFVGPRTRGGWYTGGGLACPGKTTTMMVTKRSVAEPRVRWHVPGRRWVASMQGGAGGRGSGAGNRVDGAASPPRTLGQMLKLEALVPETSEHIAQAWVAYHLHRPSSVSAVVQANTYATLRQRLLHCPRFVLPLPRGPGFVSVLMQAHAEQDGLVFALLDEYQRAADKACVPSALQLRYYTDLATTKGIVLMRGEVDLNRLTTTEAQCVVNLLQLYYLTDAAKYETRVKPFNHDPGLFRYESVIQDLQSLDLSQIEQQQPTRTTQAQQE